MNVMINAAIQKRSFDTLSFILFDDTLRIHQNYMFFNAYTYISLIYMYMHWKICIYTKKLFKALFGKSEFLERIF